MGRPMIFQGGGGGLPVLWGCRGNETCPQNVANCELKPTKNTEQTPEIPAMPQTRKFWWCTCPEFLPSFLLRCSKCSILFENVQFCFYFCLTSRGVANYSIQPLHPSLKCYNGREIKKEPLFFSRWKRMRQTNYFGYYLAFHNALPVCLFICLFISRENFNCGLIFFQS